MDIGGRHTYQVSVWSRGVEMRWFRESSDFKIAVCCFPGEAGSRMDVSGLMGQVGTGSRPVGSETRHQRSEQKKTHE